MTKHKPKYKVAIVTGMWHRHDVFRMFASGIKKLEQKIRNVEFVVIVAGSEGRLSKSLVNEYGFKYIEIDNTPLSKKMNATIKEAKKHNPDYVLCLGSDDIITPNLFRSYIPLMEKKVDYIGVLDFYFYDILSQKAMYWGGYREPYRKGHTCGAGRMLSKSILDKWNWSVWEGNDAQLDTAFQEKLDFCDHTRAVFSCKDVGAYGLDIKSAQNMTPFEEWDNTTPITKDEIKNEFEYLWLEKLIKD